MSGFVVETNLARAADVFERAESVALFNPKFSADTLAELTRRLADAPFLADHLVLTTSGTSGEPKLLALAKAAFESSAERVNRALHATPGDRWYCPLPLFHVGGLSIGVRARQLGQRAPVQLAFGAWNAAAFAHALIENECTLTALVPTQVADLVKAHLRAPAGLRRVLVGGAALPRELYRAALALGWPLVPSYGMTETCAAVALAHSVDGEAVYDIEAHSFVYEFMRGVEGGIVQPDGGVGEAGENGEGLLGIRCASLASGYLDTAANAWRLPLNAEGFLYAQDRVRFEAAGFFRHLGRADELVKVRGEFVNLHELASKIARVLAIPVAGLRLSVAADQRLHLELDAGAVAGAEGAVDADREALLGRINGAVETRERVASVEIRDLARWK